MPSPVTTLDSIPKGPASLFGEPVASLIVVFRDGRKAKIELPEAETEDQEKQRKGLPARILALLKDSPVPLTRKQVATKLGYTKAEGRFGQAVKDLIQSGEVHIRDGEISDCPEKYLES